MKDRNKKYKKYSKKELLAKVKKHLKKEMKESFETFKLADKEELIHELEIW